MNELHQTIGAVIVVVGLIFDLIGTIGLIRLPDVYNRIQAATKCVTLGTAALLVGVAIYAWSPSLSLKALVCAVFVVLTSPVSAHALARGAYLSGIRLWDGSVADAYAHRDDQSGK